MAMEGLNLPRREFTHLADIAPRPAALNRWERVRHRQAHWFAECVAEAVSAYKTSYLWSLTA